MWLLLTRSQNHGAARRIVNDGVVDAVRLRIVVLDVQGAEVHEERDGTVRVALEGRNDSADDKLAKAVDSHVFGVAGMGMSMGMVVVAAAIEFIVTGRVEVIFAVALVVPAAALGPMIRHHELCSVIC